MNLKVIIRKIASWFKTKAEAVEEYIQSVGAKFNADLYTLKTVVAADRKTYTLAGMPQY